MDRTGQPVINVKAPAPVDTSWRTGIQSFTTASSKWTVDHDNKIYSREPICLNATHPHVPYRQGWLDGVLSYPLEVGVCALFYGPDAVRSGWIVSIDSDA